VLVETDTRRELRYDGTAVFRGVARDNLSKLLVDFPNQLITVTDAQGTPVARVELGKIGVGAGDWGLRVRGAAGNVVADLQGSGLLLQNDAASPTQGILIDGTLPGAWTRYLNLNGSGSFLKHERLEFNYDGSVKMYQSSSQPLFKLDASDFLIQNDAASPTQGLLIDGTLPGTWTRYFNLNGSGSMVKHEKLELNYDGSIKMKKVTVILTSGTSWTVPSDFNPFLNTVELIGGGGNGSSGVTNTRGGAGGGGGEYRRIRGFDPGTATTVTYAIGGVAGTTSWNSGTVTAVGGSNASGSTPGVGGTGGTGGDLAKQGGAGGGASSGTGAQGGGGGGGAGGLNAAGGVGAAGAPADGGDGGNGGGPDGGAGAIVDNGAGGNGTRWAADAGSGGGGSGAGNATTGGAGGNYGGGAGGGGSSGVSNGAGGAGKQGVIVITYFPIGTL
jgi:hypothetical protein